MLDQQKLRTFIPSGSKYTRYTVVSAVSYMNIFVSKLKCVFCVCRRSNLAWEVRKTTSPIKLSSRRSLSPSASSAHRHYPHTVTPSHHHPDALAQSQPSEPNESLPLTNIKQSNDTTKKDHPVSNLDKPVLQATKSTINNRSIASTASIDTDTHPKPIILSRPSSARSLDFSSCSCEGRVDAPSLLRRSKSHGKADSATKTTGDGLTWADRVSGRTKPIMRVKSSASDSGSVVPPAPETVLKATEEDAEEGWEKVTRFRSKSACSGSKSTHNGHHKHKLKNRTSKLSSKNRSKSNSSSRSESSNSHSGSSSIEPLTPVFDELVVIPAESKPLEVETVIASVRVETGGDKEEGRVTLKELAAAEEVVMEEEKKEIEVPTSNSEVSCTRIST